MKYSVFTLFGIAVLGLLVLSTASLPRSGSFALISEAPEVIAADLSDGEASLRLKLIHNLYLRIQYLENILGFSRNIDADSQGTQSLINKLPQISIVAS